MGGCRWRRQVTASQVNRLPKYLGALPAGPNDRYGMFIPRRLLQLTQLSPGLMKTVAVVAAVNFHENLTAPGKVQGRCEKVL